MSENTHNLKLLSGGIPFAKITLKECPDHYMLIENFPLDRWEELKDYPTALKLADCAQVFSVWPNSHEANVWTLSESFAKLLSIVGLGGKPSSIGLCAPEDDETLIRLAESSRQKMLAWDELMLSQPTR